MKAVPQLDDEAADERVSCGDRHASPLLARLRPAPPHCSACSSLDTPGPGARSVEATVDEGCREGAPGLLLLEVSLAFDSAPDVTLGLLRLNVLEALTNFPKVREKPSMPTDPVQC